MIQIRFIKRKNVKLQYTYELESESIQLQFEGPMGFSKQNIIKGIGIKIRYNHFLLFSQLNEYKTFLSNFQSWYIGVIQGYYIQIRVAGVGFKGRIRDRVVVTYLCTSIFSYIRANPTLVARYRKYKIVLFGTDKADIRNIARAWQSVGIPDAYTGVGVRVIGETIYVKPGKQRI